MASRTTGGTTSLERVRRRYERTETKCPACGHVDASENWHSETDGTTVVYHHTCPSCGAERDHRFDLRG